ncbi:MAG: hypothetical protein DHS20C13_30190 [Thermodesulfobacteriota bacterium]|nr:MAG: hypothetical protein DHS20C13_30190 [Thermodesulfobacteriota bacterium]
MNNTLDLLQENRNELIKRMMDYEQIRQKQHLYNLKKEMEEPIKLLKNKKCK